MRYVFAFRLWISSSKMELPMSELEGESAFICQRMTTKVAPVGRPAGIGTPWLKNLTLLGGAGPPPGPLPPPPVSSAVAQSASRGSTWLVFPEQKDWPQWPSPARIAKSELFG